MVPVLKRPGVVVALVLAGLFALLLGFSVYESREGEPGDPQVYDDIRRTTDCQELQDGLRRNEADAARRYSQRSVDGLYDVVKSYARTYREQIDEIGC